jgi:hypothetical protein
MLRLADPESATERFEPISQVGRRFFRHGEILADL